MNNEHKKAGSSFSNRRRLAAFTLIELLVVIAIIALLVSILLPSLQSAREIAKSVKCMTNLKAIGMGVQLYAQDNNGDLPFGCDPWPSSFTWTLEEYTQATPDPTKEKGVSDSIYWCPSLSVHNQTEGWPGDFGINYNIFSPDLWDADAPRRNIDEISNPGEFVVFLDGVSWIRLEDGYENNEINRIRVHARHGNAKSLDDGKVNVLWLDTHITSEDWETVAGNDEDDTYLRYWND